MKKLLSLVTLLILSMASYAHVWEIRVNQAQNGDLTWYLQSYHTVGQCGIANSGLTINGVNYPLQSEHSGSIAGLSNNVFAVTSSPSLRASYAIVQTPFLGTNLSVQPYSTNACWAFMVGGSGNFTPPPPPVCTACPITSWSNTTGSPLISGTQCDPSDDLLPTTITVNHLSCASITGNGQFNIVYDPSGANVSYGPYSFTSGISTDVNINLPVGVSNSTQLSVTSAFPCSETHGLSIPGGSFNGVIETVPPSITAPSAVTVNVSAGGSPATGVSLGNPVASDNCSLATVTNNAPVSYPAGNTIVTWTATDVNGNTATANQTVTVKEPATAINFERNDDRIDIGNLLATNSSYTKEAWIYLETNPNDEKNIISSAKAPFYVTKAGYLRAENSFSGGTAVQDPDLLTLNQWVHVAATYDAATSIMKLYRNGVLVATNTSAIGHAAGNIAIGSFGNANTWDGSIDEVRLWNRALSKCEIQNNMNCELNPSGQSGLVALYHFNQGYVNTNNSAITTAIDASGNGNNGTLVNFALSGSSSNWTTGIASGTCSAFAPIVTTVTTSGSTTICSGDSVTLTASSSTGYSYQWQLNGNDLAGATSASYTAFADGSYTVVITQNGCSAISAATTVTVNTLPTATITTSGATTFCTGGSVILSSSTGNSYQWQIGGMDIAGATSSTYTTNNSGNYSVRITDANECSATSSTTTVTEKGVWTPAGCPGFTSGRVFTTALVADTNDHIYVAYQDNGNSNKTSVQKYDGNNWTQVGAAGFSSAGDRQDFVIGADNLPYIVVSEYGIGATVYKYDGSNWTVVGGAGFSPGAVSNTSLAIDNNGVLYVSFRDNANGNKLTVMKYNGSAWVTVGGAGVSAGTVYDPQIAIDQNNIPYVVYGDNSVGGKATVLKYNGSSWVAIGGVGFTTNFVVNSTITIAPNGTPYIAFKDGFPQGPATVMSYNGTAWMPVGNAGFSQGFIDHITLAFDSQNKLIASYRDDANNLSITTQKFDNGIWTPIGAQGITTNTANQGSFVIDGSDNMYVAFRDFNSGSRLTVMKTGPTAATSIAANGPTDLCAGSTVQLSVAACNGSSYQWMNNGVNIAGANNATYTASTSGTYTVNISSAGCSSISDSINVSIKQATVITACAQDDTLNATTGNCSANATYTVSATGETTPTFTYVFTGATTANGSGTGSGSSFNVGTTNVMVIASDVCGNDTCAFTVTVIDNQAPTITCLADILAYADNGLCEANNITLAPPTTSDNCGVASITNDALLTYPVGTTTVTWTATDVHGNSAICTQKVTVIDNQAPIVARQNQTIYLDASGSASISAGDINNGSTDNCGIDTITLDKTSFSCSDAGSNTVTLTVTDVHGNSANGTATVTVVDTVKPVITCPSSVTVSCQTSPAGTGVATATDACGVNTVTYSDASTYSSNPADAAHYNYTISRTWTATDVHNNSSSCTQIITVQQLKLTADVTNVSCNGDNSGSIDLTVEGGVGNLTYSWSNNATTEDVNGITAGTYSVTVTDGSGCTAMASYTVTEPTILVVAPVSMSPNPTVSGQAMNTIFLGYGPQSVTLSSVASGGTPGYTYSWTPTTGVQSPSSASTVVSPTATTLYTLTVTDANGCTNSSTFNVKVIDVTSGKNGKKVTICHKGKTLSVSINAVPAHLNHGDILGSCNNQSKGSKGETGEGQLRGIAELTQIRELKVYPNPNNGTFIVDLPEQVKGGEVTFRDMSGKVVKRKNFMPEEQLKFSMPDVADGMYMIEVLNSNEIYRARIVIQR